MVAIVTSVAALTVMAILGRFGLGARQRIAVARAVAFVAAFAMLSSLVSWGLSLIFTGLLVRELPLGGSAAGTGINTPAGFALGNATGDGNTWTNWLVWAFGGKLVDPQARVVLREFLQGLRGEGRTLIFTTHNMDEAERLCRSLVADYPDDVEAWLQLGEGLAHGNPLRGRSSVEARPAFEEVLARDPDNSEALIHLARIASIQGKQPEADTLLRRRRLGRFLDEGVA